MSDNESRGLCGLVGPLRTTELFFQHVYIVHTTRPGILRTCAFLIACTHTLTRNWLRPRSPSPRAARTLFSVRLRPQSTELRSDFKC